MIWFANFVGRQVKAIGIFYPIQTFCYGDNEDAARLNLYDRYEHIMHLKLVELPVVKVGDCQPGDRIYRVENGQVVPNLTYIVARPCEIVGPVACIQTSTGVKVQVAPTLECVVNGQWLELLDFK